MNELANSAVAQWGAVGLLLAVLVYGLLRSWKTETDLRAELKLEHKARLDDAKANTQAMLDMNDRVHETVERLAEVAERLTSTKS